MSDLLPFPDPALSRFPFRITAFAQIHAGALSLRYELRGNLGGVAWPEREDNPRRRDGLWKTTCLEAFFLEAGGSRYWEVNLSPSGDWNVYSFAGYRQGMEPEDRITALSGFRTEAGGDSRALSASIPLAPLLSPRPPVKIGLAAVIEHLNGKRSYWALKHCGTKPDFHVSDSFIFGLT